jgi:peroxiredoxin
MSPKLVSGLLIALSTSVVLSAAQATMPGQVVADFKLTDHAGKARSLYEPTSTKPVVVMIQGNGCPIVRHAMISLREISERYADKGVRFMLLNSNLQDNPETITKEVTEFEYPFPVLVDKNQKVGEALQVQRNSEVFVIDPQTRKLVYRGPLDDRLSYERQRPATKHYLGDALDAVLAGQPVKVPYADGVGCIVNFPDRKTTNVVDHSKMGH